MTALVVVCVFMEDAGFEFDGASTSRASHFVARWLVCAISGALTGLFALGM